MCYYSFLTTTLRTFQFWNLYLQPKKISTKWQPTKWSFKSSVLGHAIFFCYFLTKLNPFYVITFFPSFFFCFNLIFSFNIFIFPPVLSTFFLEKYICPTFLTRGQLLWPCTWICINIWSVSVLVKILLVDELFNNEFIWCECLDIFCQSGCKAFEVSKSNYRALIWLRRPD